MKRLLSLFGFVAVLSPSLAFGQTTKINSYLFDDAAPGVGGVIDSIGGQHGTLIDPAGTFGVLAGGRIDLTRNNGANSKQDGAVDPSGIDVGAYIDLPDGISNAAFSANNAATFEAWFTIEQNRNFARLYDFGTSFGGENVSNNGAEYLSLAPQAGGAGNPIQFASRESVSGIATAVNGAGPVPAGEKAYVVTTIDGNDTSAGPAGTVRIYVGVGETAPTEVAMGKISDDLPLDAVADFGDMMPVNQWLGRSQFGNALFDGFIDEFNIYNGALSASEVTANFATGPVEFNGPSVIVDRDTGAVQVLNETAFTQQLTSYSITSAEEALDPDGLVGISGWTTNSSADAEVAQSGSATNLDATGLALGSVWKRSPFEDLTFEFTLQSGENSFSEVTYIGDPIARSDLDVDGDVDIDDYAIFIANGYTDISSLAKIDAYFLGDIDGDLDVDINDFFLFKDDFLAAGGVAAELGAFVAAPEPATGFLMLGALVGVSGYVRRR